MIEGVVAEVVAGAERVSRGSQAFLHIQRDRVVATEHAPSYPFRVFEHRHGLADIGARGGAVVEECTRISRSHIDDGLVLPRDDMGIKVFS